MQVAKERRKGRVPAPYVDNQSYLTRYAQNQARAARAVNEATSYAELRAILEENAEEQKRLEREFAARRASHPPLG